MKKKRQRERERSLDLEWLTGLVGVENKSSNTARCRSSKWNKVGQREPEAVEYSFHNIE